MEKFHFCVYILQKQTHPHVQDTHTMTFTGCRENKQNNKINYGIFIQKHTIKHQEWTNYYYSSLNNCKAKYKKQATKLNK